MGAGNGFRKSQGATHSGRSFPVVMFALVLLAATAIPGAYFQVTGAAASEPLQKSKGPQTKWEGTESELVEPFTGIITNKTDWKELWIKAFRKDAPKLDFQRYAVAFVFLGHYPGWWYNICWAEPYTSGATIVVPYELVALIIELQNDGKGPSLREQGNRGQYKMKVVEKKPGFFIKISQIGEPQVQLKKNFGSLLEKDRYTGTSSE
jgi:hypothetical protein